MSTIEAILIERDHLSEAEARQEVAEAKNRLYLSLEHDADDFDAAFDAMESLGLEPDYLEELLGY